MTPEQVRADVQRVAERNPPPAYCSTFYPAESWPEAEREGVRAYAEAQGWQAELARLGGEVYLHVWSPDQKTLQEAA